MQILIVMRNIDRSPSGGDEVISKKVVTKNDELDA